MARRRRRALRLSPRLVWLAEAADRECPQGHSAALLDLGAMAVIKAPSRGVLWNPRRRYEDDLRKGIEIAAQQHLGYDKPDAAFDRSLEAIAAKATSEERSALATSRSDAESISDTVHYYAGLAFGVTFVDCKKRWPVAHRTVQVTVGGRRAPC
jgi:hypothetical protein